jgi:Integrase core domain
VPFLERAIAWFARHGVTVERVMTDNGSAYRSRHWRHACGALALRHIRTKPYTPRTNSKAERFIQTSLREWAYARPFATSHERTAALIPWLDYYNRARPHATLAHRPPATRLCRSAFLGSTDKTVPPSRPAAPHDRSAGSAQGAPRRPALAGAKRPCGDPPDRSRSNRRVANARSPEQRCWKRQLGQCWLPPAVSNERGPLLIADQASPSPPLATWRCLNSEASGWGRGPQPIPAAKRSARANRQAAMATRFASTALEHSVLVNLNASSSFTSQGGNPPPRRGQKPAAVGWADRRFVPARADRGKQGPAGLSAFCDERALCRGSSAA